MLNLKIRIVSFLARWLIAYQNRLETWAWLKEQRCARYEIPGLSEHLRRDIGLGHQVVKQQKPVAEAKFEAVGQPEAICETKTRERFRRTQLT